MIRTTISLTLALALLAIGGAQGAPATGEEAPTAPPAPSVFGLSAGQPIDELAIAQRVEDLYVLASVPTPSPAFTKYAVIGTRTTGVCKIVALTEARVDRQGALVREDFEAITALLMERYGAPTQTFTFAQEGAIWTGVLDWSRAVYHDERVHAAYWTRGLPHGFAGIALVVTAPDRDSTALSLTYEYTCFASFLRERTKAIGTGL